MDGFFINIYKEQILDQIGSAEAAYSIITDQNSDIDLLFRNIHHFIVHVSNIVKIIQPKISGDLDFKNYRMKQLKLKYPKLPNINQKSILIRNDFEHYDERVDSWIINSKRHNYVDKNISNVNRILGIDPKDNFRSYNPDSNTLYFSGERFPLTEFYTYIQEVKQALS